ncbi:MAG TPA: flagellar hook capping FlgD N-terminal domain-containing protein [Edaphobacter sp.]|uniref:flagellar hook assembly protein FlgD n=1 Tax=Edaphobacter sp. TaxID=1934404 RepID=UPI002BF4E608|nr:flagellar hook capping FlgD N-terminal domain-containing protein [Edaphobacter sp.]HUZ93333.1 flagellar hook capping FlgD N-terminal domain-containing protein [Edaphobacter sp.]
MNVSDMNSVMGAGANAATTVASALSPRATAKDAAATSNAASSNTSSTATGGATITSSDFLTLLVTELKNQDPTQPTDPNAYIQQLVGVNSLQQLISINQDLTPATSSTSTSSS